jgi:poly(A) polymerase
VSQRSLNGLRVADYFVKNYSENPKFRRALSLVKLWAIKRGVYGGITGYLGGLL